MEKQIIVELFSTSPLRFQIIALINIVLPDILLTIGALNDHIGNGVHVEIRFPR